MVVEEPSLEFMLRQHQQFFPKLPVVFLGIEELSQQMLDTPWLTGVVEDRSIVETVVEATRETWSNTAVVVNDTSERGKANLEKIAAIKNTTNQSLKIEVVNDLAPEDVKEKLSVYPPSVPIIMLGQLYESREGQSLIDPSLDAQILGKTNP
ncbi:MAG: hypothetical protein HC930_08810 [Hydrococcus sp. SU_1_0]|nr:hypothetical protein [Hydrococcus sp. SU_1_0]